MKKFILGIFCVTLMFLGLGVVVQEVGAKFKSDQKALELVALARTALGGDQALNEIKGLSIKGRSTRSIEIDGAARPEIGETEYSLEFPSVFAKRTSIGDQLKANSVEGHNIVVETTSKVEVVKGIDSSGRSKIMVTPVEGSPVATRSVTVKGDGNGTIDLVTVDGKKVLAKRFEEGDQRDSDNGQSTMIVRTLKNGDENGQDLVFERASGPIKTVKGHAAGNTEMTRLALMLLLAPPTGMNAEYKFLGEGNVDGSAVNTINITAGGSEFTLHLDRYSNLPIAMDYTDSAVVKFVLAKNVNGDVITEDIKGTMVTGFAADSAPVRRQVKLSDYRNINGVLLPHAWTTSSEGKVSDTFEVSSYVINPVGIFEKLPALKHVKKEKN